MVLASQKIVDYDTYVQERIINGTLPLDNTYFLVNDLIDELPDEEKIAFRKRVECATEELPMPIELLVHYLNRDKSSNTSKYYTHSGRTHTLGDLILIAGKFKRKLFSIYRDIMKKKNKKFAIYETEITGGFV